MEFKLLALPEKLLSWPFSSGLRRVMADSVMSVSSNCFWIWSVYCDRQRGERQGKTNITNYYILLKRFSQQLLIPLTLNCARVRLLEEQTLKKELLISSKSTKAWKIHWDEGKVTHFYLSPSESKQRSEREELKKELKKRGAGGFESWESAAALTRESRSLF